MIDEDRPPILRIYEVLLCPVIVGSGLVVVRMGRDDNLFAGKG